MSKWLSVFCSRLGFGIQWKKVLFRFFLLSTPESSTYSSSSSSSPSMILLHDQIKRMHEHNMGLTHRIVLLSSDCLIWKPIPNFLSFSFSFSLSLSLTHSLSLSLSLYSFLVLPSIAKSLVHLCVYHCLHNWWNRRAKYSYSIGHKPLNSPSAKVSLALFSYSHMKKRTLLLKAFYPFSFVVMWNKL